MAEQFGIECRHHVRGPANALRLADESVANQVDEIRDVRVDRSLGARRVIRCLGFAVHTAAGHPRGLEPGLMVEGVEVAVGGIAGIPGFR